MGEKKYRLLKDTPQFKKDTVFVQKYFPKLKANGLVDESYGYGKKSSENPYYINFPADIVENNPEWFEEVISNSLIHISLNDGCFKNVFYKDYERQQHYFLTKLPLTKTQVFEIEVFIKEIIENK